MGLSRRATVLAAVAVAAAAAQGAAAAPLPIVHDDRAWQTPGTASPTLLQRMVDVRALGASWVQTDLLWSSIATRRPADPANPMDPAYDWRGTDAAVTAAARTGNQVQFALYRTPAWAGGGREGNRAPRDLGDLDAFARAVGTRYSGRYRAGPMPEPLPRVERFVAWNEPNQSLFLVPQFRRGPGGALEPAAPGIYAGILAAIRDGLRAGMEAAGADDPVVAGGATAPTGDADPKRLTARLTPAAFIADLARQSPRPEMDAWAHHPYPLRPPTDSTPPEAAVIDAWNLGALERALDATGGDSPLSGLPIWVTEFGVLTEAVPNFKKPVDEATASAWIAEGWRRFAADDRIDEVVLYFLQDNEFWRSGLRATDWRPKLDWVATRRAFAAAGGG